MNITYLCGQEAPVCSKSIIPKYQVEWEWVWETGFWSECKN